MTKTDQTALELIDKILTGTVPSIYEEDFQFLLEYKESCTRKLLPILAYEIVQIKEGEPWDRTKLHRSLQLLAAFEEKKAFDWVIQLHEYPEALEDGSGYFIVLYWADILVATLSNEWHKLIETLDNPEIYEEFKDACLDALVGLVAKQRLDRSIVVEFLQSFYCKVLQGEPFDIDLLSTVLEASLVLWPGESMNEIKEIFGLDLVDDEIINLEEIMEGYQLGKEQSLKDLQNNWTEPAFFGDMLVKKNPIEEADWNPRSFEIENSDSENQSEFDEYDFEEEIEFFEKLENTLPPLLPCPEIDCFASLVQKKYQSLPRLLLEDPETALEVAADLVADSPEVPAFFYYFHEALMTLDAKLQGMEVVKKWVELFPDDLLGKIEYAHYFLRRGEPEKAANLFENTWSLSALYPQKASFHEIECLRFFNFLGCYFLQIGEIEKAKEQIQILDATNPNSFEYYHLKRKVSFHLNENFFIEE